MKTKLLFLPDWQDVLQGIGWEDAPSQEDVENVVKRELTRGAVTFEEQPAGTPIENGCRVTLKAESVLSKFNREKTVVTVGAHLYDAGIEAQLCGMTAGQSMRSEVKGENVKVTVQKVEKKVYPPLSDKLVQNLQLEGISTLSAYRGYMEQRLRENHAAALCQKLLDRLLTEAKIAQPEEEDILAVIDREYEPLRTRFSLDELSAEEWEKSFGDQKFQPFYAQIYPEVANLLGTTGKESYYERRRESAVRAIRACLVLRSILLEQTDVTDPTIECHAQETLLRSMEGRLLKLIYGG